MGFRFFGFGSGLSDESICFGIFGFVFLVLVCGPLVSQYVLCFLVLFLLVVFLLVLVWGSLMSQFSMFFFGFGFWGFGLGVSDESICFVFFWFWFWFGGL